MILSFLKRLLRKSPRPEIFECVYGEDDSLLWSGTYNFIRMPEVGDVVARDGVVGEVTESKFYPGMRTIVTVVRRKS